MKYKYLVSVAALSLVLVAPAAAQIVQYSDDYVSFSYDDETIGQIRRHTDAASDSFYYSLDSGYLKSNGSISCTIGVKPNDSMFGADFYQDTSDPNYPRKVVEESDTQFSYMSMGGDSEDPARIDQARIIYDSAEFNVSLEDIDIKADEDELIFSNVILSDQGYTYAEEALNILKSYMDFSLSSRDAANQISELYDRLDNYVETSDYCFDYDVEQAIYLMDVNIGIKQDGEVQKAIEELNILLSNK